MRTLDDMLLGRGFPHLRSRGGSFWGSSAMALIYNTRNYYAGSVQSFDDLHTITSQSASTVFNAGGDMETVTSGSRYDHDPVTGEALGLLVETEATQLVEYSEAVVGTGWQETGAVNTELALNALGIFRGVSAASQGAVWHRADVSAVNRPAVTNGVGHAVTFFYRAGTSGDAFLVLRDVSGATESTIRGTIGSLAANTSAAGSITDVVETLLSDGETYRLTCVITPNFTGDMSVGMGPYSTTVGETIIALGIQVEEGAFATSYIPSSGGTVTRNSDQVSVALSDFAFDTSSGSLVVEYQAMESQPVADGFVFCISDDTSSNRIELQQKTTGAPTFTNVEGGVADASIAGTDPGDNTLTKCAVAWAANDYALVQDGVVEGSDVAATVPTGLTTLHIGKNGWSNAGQLNGQIKSIRYYPERLSNAELQELTS